MASCLRIDIAAPPPPRGGAAHHRTHRAISAVLVLALAGVFLPARSPAAPPPPPSATTSRTAAAPPTTQQYDSLFDAGRYAEAETVARALYREEERVHRDTSAGAAWALRLQAEAMRCAGKGTDPETRAVADRAFRLSAKAVGADSEATLSCEVVFAMVLYERYELDEAIRHLKHVVAVREHSLGPTSGTLAVNIRSLAVAEDRADHDSAAVPLAERAIEMQRAMVPVPEDDLAQSLNVLASILYVQGDLARAGPMYEEALERFTRAHGPDHRAGIQCLYNLGALRCEEGDYEAARRYQVAALEGWRRTVGPTHPYVGLAMFALGTTLEALGDLPGARAYLERALPNLERGFGAEYPEVADALVWLGRLDLSQGRYRSAKSRLDRALAIQERAYGANSPQLALGLSALAAVQEREHDPRAARSSYQRALAIQERAYSKSHPDRIRILNDYAGFLVRSGDSTMALDAALQSASARSVQLRDAIRGFSERQSLLYLSFGTAGLDLALALTARGVGGPEGFARSWDAAIRSRTLVLDEMASRQGVAARAATDSGLATTVLAVDGARRRYATLLVRGPGHEGAERPRSALDRAREEMERAERDLALRSSSFREEEVRSRTGLREVAAAIPADAALVAFELTGAGDARAYVAFITTPSGPPRMLALGRARTLDASVGRWLAEIVRAPTRDRGPDASGAERSCREAGDAVRRRVWDPIARLLGAVPRVFIVPDGAICRVNFAALPDGPDGYLAERGPLFHLLASERDMIRPERRHPVGVGLLALGGPAFEERGRAPRAGAHVAAGEGGQAHRSADGTAAEGPDCADFGKLRFGPLPGAAREAEEIARMWPDSSSVVLLVGAQASQNAFEALAPGKRVVHLATHGFFLDGSRCAAGARGRRGIGGVSGPDAAGVPAPRTVGVQSPGGSPLRLSGLALAGANRRKDARSGEDDGILTAEEVASINLSGVEWAVLSACDTGTGSVEPSEGVIGLRRAFQIAGARTVIMSLWGVEDQSTLRWMQALYEARFRHGLGTAEAVREASRSVLRERRAQGRSTHPFYWAGFVASGDWR